MSDQSTSSRLLLLEDLMISSFNLSFPLGVVFSRIFELMHTVIKSGVEKKAVVEAIGILARERDHAMSRYQNKSEPFPSHVYALAENLVAMMVSIVEERQSPADRSQADNSATSSDTSLNALEQDEQPCSSRQAEERDLANALRRKRFLIGEHSEAPTAKVTHNDAARTPTAAASVRAPAAAEDANPAEAGATRAVMLNLCDDCETSFDPLKDYSLYSKTVSRSLCSICNREVDPNKTNVCKYYVVRCLMCGKAIMNTKMKRHMEDHGCTLNAQYY